ncbi:glutamate--tRNA ligase [Tenacibaculum finnmarkense genomovar finnmarkense]|uniref:glutamate--tRNA ligase n=1 Tax=Tenacibaculum finnmarkense TaxID=2781243 RepID=UPI001E28724B|nr:glutamate--tRNA ligase [Tenacibaculum finnmarkense]MCD8417001.1 glutamate--tRNA ligase [Tenacibaculum finnmarkense genomovar finnmarkense]MCG8184606.1 glutamate--tRNA ligase [Tenacibaculum finnmarkense genomovar finnmarkense]MCG8208688.1 glutamate--tRNA ligase [Tenacibaculum finnmarkense genomovar finnmarkense]MCG8211419.1 glutamate--tRNA ligase [Tenacibaculum finnmarkense genomovar finnmarkense]MCG8219519.1 glutamate--tRNA ligase [Tenacibaculum finnmarkense genomovar finnmarkense]
MTDNVRVRFAPSPTGPLHIGGVRTALFNYLFAKKYNGTFVLRIEDTDQTRYVKNAEQYIVDALKWCNIPFDEGPNNNEKFGPYRQSERKELYQKYADILLEKGWAYYAFDTAEELDAHRKNHEENGKTFTYNWHNRQKLNSSLALSSEEVEAKLAAGDKYVVRFKTPQDETLILEDEIRGKIKIDTNVLDDKVLFKSDGMPTYHLANIVDDHLMEISHVIRGEEWLPSMALHILLYRAFDWKAPKFAHLPLILKPVGKGKLSKRDGDKLGFPVFPLEYTNEQTGDVSRGYKEDGYFNDAFINMLALLGWNPGTEQEIFSLEELVEAFDLSRVSKSGAKFSPDKTKWFNQQYLQTKSDEELTALYIPILEEKGITADENFTQKIVSLIKERATFVADFWELSSFFFENPSEYDEKAAKKQWKETTSELMQELIIVISSIEDFTIENAQTEIKGWITTKEIGFGKVMQPLRLSLVGKLAGPDLFDIMTMIGKENTIARIKNAIEKLS